MDTNLRIVDRTEERRTVLRPEPRQVRIREFRRGEHFVCRIPDGASTEAWQAALDLCEATGFDYPEASRRSVDMEQRALCHAIIADVAPLRTGIMDKSA